MTQAEHQTAYRLACAALAVTVTLVCRCAHQVSPSGGPADETPPRMIVSYPAQGMVNTPRQAVVSVTFSEWVSPQSAEKCVSFFPPPPGGFKIRVRGKRVDLSPAKPLADSTTYHVEFSTGLKDLHSQPIGTPFQLIFSTGPCLDSGSVSGCMVLRDGPFSQPKAALFAVTDSQPPLDTALFRMPDYIAQTDSFGAFTLPNIRKGSYEIIGFADANNDNRLQAGREDVYAAVTRRIRVTDRVDSIVMFAVSCDTTARRVLRIRPVSATLLAGEWNRRAASSADSVQPSTMRVVSLDSTVTSPAVVRHIAIAASPRFALELDRPLELNAYLFIYEKSPRVPDTASLLDTIRFNGIVTADTVRPRLVRRPKNSTGDLQPALDLTYSEPVRCTAGRVLFADTLGDSVAAAFDTAFADTFVLRPVRRLRPGSRYRLMLSADSVVDMAGNAVAADSADSGRIGLTVETLHPDSLCLSISGSTPCPNAAPGRTWRFVPHTAGAAPYLSPDRGGAFRFDSLPAGRGSLSWFDDRNGNLLPDGGELLPWIAPEPFGAAADTVEARARWDIEGVMFPLCDPCSINRSRRPAPRGKNQRP